MLPVVGVLATLGEKVRALRRQRDLSQVQLATALGISRSALAGIESPSRARDVPSLKVALRIALFFGVSADQLLRPNIEIGELTSTISVRDIDNISVLERFKDKLRQLRKVRGLSLDALGQILGYSHKHLSHLEVGERYPSIELVLHIADYFDVPTDTLLYDSLELPYRENLRQDR